MGLGQLQDFGCDRKKWDFVFRQRQIGEGGVERRDLSRALLTPRDSNGQST